MRLEKYWRVRPWLKILFGGAAEARQMPSLAFLSACRWRCGGCRFGGPFVPGRRPAIAFGEEVDKSADFRCQVPVGNEVRDEAFPKRPVGDPFRQKPDQLAGCNLLRDRESGKERNADIVERRIAHRLAGISLEVAAHRHAADLASAREAPQIAADRDRAIKDAIVPAQIIRMLQRSHAFGVSGRAADRPM